jgi:DNA-binding transcriptional LysR family regulator
LNDLNVEPLFDDPWVMVASTNSRWVRRRKIDLTELLGESWLVPPQGTSGFKVLAEAFRVSDLAMPTPTLATYSMALRAKLSARGRFITFLPKSFLDHGDDRNRLCELPVGIPFKPWSVAILTLKNRNRSPIVESFIESAHEIANSQVDKSRSRTLRI